eukprot:TRINITY_DN6218_c0_g1_i2.p2 TRINITY_DN6218_c0_g1~~TRINITY_DN6218_c0_g1_i2.p2  ORF type:complete len:107 (-),score=20.76 TRINITY_DN6218_c0_g1_i2:142-462(-)
MFVWFFFFNDTATTEIYTRSIVGSVRCVQETDMKSCLQPAPKVLVSCRDANGKDNALAVGYCGNCSYDPPMVMVGIVPSRYSYNICLLYTSPSPRDLSTSRMPSSA